MYTHIDQVKPSHFSKYIGVKKIEARPFSYTTLKCSLLTKCPREDEVVYPTPYGIVNDKGGNPLSNVLGQHWVNLG